MATLLRRVLEINKHKTLESIEMRKEEEKGGGKKEENMQSMETTVFGHGDPW